MMLGRIVPLGLLIGLAIREEVNTTLGTLETSMIVWRQESGSGAGQSASARWNPRLRFYNMTSVMGRLMERSGDFWLRIASRFSEIKNLVIR